MGPNEAIQVTLNSPAYIRFMDDENYKLYRHSAQYHYHGGLANISPSNAKPPKPGHWHLVIDLGGKPGELTATVNIIQEVLPDKKK